MWPEISKLSLQYMPMFSLFLANRVNATRLHKVKRIPRLVSLELSMCVKSKCLNVITINMSEVQVWPTGKVVCISVRESKKRIFFFNVIEPNSHQFATITLLNIGI